MKRWGSASETGVKGKGLIGAINTDTRFGVFSNAFLKEVGFALEADGFHPFERVPNFEVSVAAKAKKESVGAESDVVAHHGGIHADEFDREDVDNKFHFDCNSTADDLDNS
jgi:hypothetical protein